jgi:hypothetical protein
MLEAMARIAPSQLNEVMARIAPQRNGTISLDPSCRVKIPEKGSLNLIRNCSRRTKKIQKGDWAWLFQKPGSTPPRTTRTHNTIFSVAAISAESDSNNLHNTQHTRVKNYSLLYAKGRSAQPDMLWRTHHTKLDPNRCG